MLSKETKLHALTNDYSAKKQNEKAKKKLMMEKIGTLLKEWKLIPQSHEVNENILFGILDKDKDNDFSY